MLECEFAPRSTRDGRPRAAARAARARPRAGRTDGDDKDLLSSAIMREDSELARARQLQARSAHQLGENSSELLVLAPRELRHR